jgi:hypothetical protein
VATCKISGKRDGGRFFYGLANWMGEKSIAEMINKDRNGSRYMTAKMMDERFNLQFSSIVFMLSFE